MGQRIFVDDIGYSPSELIIAAFVGIVGMPQEVVDLLQDNSIKTAADLLRLADERGFISVTVPLQHNPDAFGLKLYRGNVGFDVEVHVGQSSLKRGQNDRH